jgi:hypothetical protein
VFSPALKTYYRQNFRALPALSSSRSDGMNLGVRFNELKARKDASRRVATREHYTHLPWVDGL